MAIHIGFAKQSFQTRDGMAELVRNVKDVLYGMVEMFMCTREKMARGYVAV